MTEWNKRLYEHYVTTGQSGYSASRGIRSNPYYDRLIARHVPSDRNVAVLDLACGYGGLVSSLKQAGYRNVRGVDFSAEQVEAARREGLENVECADIREFAANAARDRFDLVFLMDILEHLDKQDVFDLLDDLHRVLRPGGRLILHVPNAEGLFGMRVRYGDYTHFGAFTPVSARQVLHACGYRDVSCHEDRPVPHGLKSTVRALLWSILTIVPRLQLLAETGNSGHVLSQNMLVTCAVDK